MQPKYCSTVRAVLEGSRLVLYEHIKGPFPGLKLNDLLHTADKGGFMTSCSRALTTSWSYHLNRADDSIRFIHNRALEITDFEHSAIFEINLLSALILIVDLAEPNISTIIR